MVNSSYREDIDGLRSIAILAVLFYHLDFTWFKGGFLGVDIFFVISGYVVSSSIFNKDIKSFNYLPQFYYKRIRRLLPNCLVLLLFTTLLTAMFIPPDKSFEIIAALPWIIWGAGNFYYYNNSSSYFNLDLKMNPLTHTWLLGVEEQYYLIYPIIVIFLLQRVKENNKNFEKPCSYTLKYLLP